jgi:PAS domain S-box-containing protein
MSDPPVGNLLIVDDEIELTTALCEMLNRQAYAATGYTSPKQALAALEEQSFDVLLADLMMPEMDGITLLRAALKTDPDLVGIIMTGHGTVQTAVEAMKVGAFDYVLKPFKLTALLPILSRAMQVHQLKAENVQLRQSLAIYELTQAIAYTLDPTTILCKAADAALEQCQADEVSIMLPTEDGSELYVSVVRGGNRTHLLGDHVPIDKGIAGWVARHREPVTLRSPVNDTRFTPIKPRDYIQCSVSVPMLAGSRLVGVLNVNATHPRRHFTLGEVKALSILANIAASALESANLFAQVRQAEERYRLIVENVDEVIYKVRTEGDPSAGVVEYVSGQVEEILGYGPDEFLRDQGLWRRIMCDEDVPVVEQQTLAIVNTKRPGTREYRLRHKQTGACRWMEDKVVPLFDEQGKWIGLQGVARDVTERKLAEAALRESRQTLEAVVETAPTLIVLTDPDGRIILFNRACEALTGYDRNEVLGKGLTELLVPARWRPVVESRFADIYAPEVRAPHQNPWVTKSGEERLIEWQCTVLPFSEGGKPLVLGTGVDITDRERAAAALKESEARFRTLAEATASAIFILQGSRFVYANPAAEAQSGFTAQELRSMDFWEFVHPDFRELARDRWLRRMRGEEALQRYELKSITKSGEERWADITSALIEYQGAPAVLATAFDITERKHAEESLRRSEERYRELFENANDIVYTHDLAGNFTALNKAGEVVTGYTREEALRMNVIEVVAPECLEVVTQMLTRKVAEGGTTSYELTIISKTGQRVALEVSTRLIYEGGQPVGVQGIARDVTARRLLEDQLRQSQKMDAIGRLAGGVAHDFNNLLTAIIGYSQLGLSRLEPGDPLRHEMEEISNAGARAASLTSQLLAFSRKQVLNPRIVDLNAIVTNIDKMLRRLIGEDIEVITILDSGLERIKADAGQIEQVILNLAVNARDAMPKGGRLTIETANRDVDLDFASYHIGLEPGRYVMLTVSDTGCGMDAETQGRIFEPFFTTKEPGQGTGLGLATAYGVVNQSGGRILVESEVGRGTTFRVLLPAALGVAVAEAPTEQSDLLLTGTETLLLVEDDQFARKLALKVLQEGGYRVLETSSPTEALAKVRDAGQPIDLVVTDVVMPEMSGRAMADRIREIRPSLPILFVSGYTDDALLRHGVLEEGTALLQKPFTPESLARKVRELLDADAAKGRAT